jgi:hypothetical protein
MNVMLERRQLRVWANMAAGVLGAIVICAPVRLIARGAPISAEVNPSLILGGAALTFAACVWAYVFARRAFLALDEFQKEASKFGWYWGATMGLMAALPVYVFIGFGGLHWLFPTTFHLGADLLRAFQIGFLLPVLLQLLGFLAVRTWWRTNKG